MTEKLSILLVDDEPNIREGLKDFLEFHHFEVTTAHDGPMARQCVEKRRFDLILLDLMLPKISGEQLCQMWRQQGLPTPIIMLTAKGCEKEKVAGLYLGADDYVTKPFSLEELLARIEAILRRMRPERTVGRRFQFGGWQVDTDGLKIRRDRHELAISRREADIMQCFAANPNRVISRDELYRIGWKEDMTGLETRTVDMHIAKLRSKIEADAARPLIIRTVRRAGYCYDGDGAIAQ